MRYNLFVNQKEFIDNLKNNDMKKILASIVVFKQPLSELQKFFQKGKKTAKSQNQNESIETSFVSGTFKNEDSMDSRMREVSNLLPSFSKKAKSTLSTPSTPKFKSSRMELS